MKTELMAAVLAAMLAAAPAAADPVEALFAPGALETVAEGTVLDFSRTLSVPEGSEINPVTGAPVAIEIEPERAVIRFELQGRPQVFQQPISAAHPLLLLFLETSHKTVADLSGGSPFYIKNRIVESFARAETTETDIAGKAAREIRLRPFAEDVNAPRMGDFAELEIIFVMADVPGGLYSATAEAGGYSESITWSTATEDEG